MTLRYLWLTTIVLWGIACGPVQADDAAMLESCRLPVVEAKMSCFQQQLEEALKTGGTEQALSLLEMFAREDSDALRETHPLVHHLGQRSFVHYGSAGEAMAHCRDVFWSGCYHGVLQAYLTSLPSVEAQHIVSLCPATGTAADFLFKRYNCLHGIGHGVTIQFRFDVLKSLAHCDYLTSEWDRESCYGGVFMENIVTFQNARQAQHAHHHHDQAPATSFMNAQDLLYPCTALSEKYLRSCYLMQTSAVLTFLNYDFAQAFTQCERVTGDHQTTCFRSLGRDISGFTLRDPQRVTELCGLGKGDQVRQCFIGAVKDFMLTDASPDPGLAFCRHLDDQFKADCYSTLAEIVVTLYSDREQRNLACRKGESEYVDTCLTLVGAY
ncbi:MAG: hypothetical protein ABW047_04610 [Nitrospiraceae bacterium]